MPASLPIPTLDINIIIRHLTADHPDHSPRARRVFDQLAAGTSPVTLREAVLVESVRVLSSKVLYNLPRQKRLYLQALELYDLHAPLSFVDCLLIAVAEREDGAVLAFDRQFDRVGTITRSEP